MLDQPKELQSNELQQQPFYKLEKEQLGPVKGTIANIADKIRKAAEEATTKSTESTQETSNPTKEELTKQTLEDALKDVNEKMNELTEKYKEQPDFFYQEKIAPLYGEDLFQNDPQKYQELTDFVSKVSQKKLGQEEYSKGEYDRRIQELKIQAEELVAKLNELENESLNLAKNN